jgi:D-3-phosphoglycerate dehydrogenase / 2-oxoglutarate reductase
MDQLERMGCEITNEPDLTAEEIPAKIADNEVLIVRSTKVTEATIDVAESLSLIIRAGAGVNTIALDAAAKKGIHVANCPGKNSDAVAELAIGLLIAADRRISFAHKDIQNGEWKKKEYGKASGLKGRTLGLIGLGSIGKSVVKRALGLEMNVIGWSRSLTPEKAEELGIGFCRSAFEVAEKAAAVSLHIAVKPETEHMVNAEFLSKMRDGAILINTSRGEIVDTEALKQAIIDKNLRVALDVFENEPKGGVAEFADTELAKLATCTPHVGASTDQSTEAIAEEVVSIVEAYQESGIPLNVVNIRQKSSAVYSLVIRHYNKVGVLAGVLDTLRDKDINIEEMQNVIFEGGYTATCSLKLDRKPSADVITLINKLDEVIKAE